MNNLQFVPKTEFDRVIQLNKDPITVSPLFATMCRINTLYMIAYAGSGHLGSSFSSLDMMVWLYLRELRRKPTGEPLDTFFSSKGHDTPALYSVLISLGLLPFDKLHTLRRLGGLPGHPDVSVPHIAANSGSLGMGISKAKGMISADRLNGQERKIYVMTGDGELQEGQVWESLQGAANTNMAELTVIVDHNKIQSDHWVTDTSDLGDIEARFTSFGWHVQRCDGHNFEALSKSFAMCNLDNRPSVIIADTVKGKGVDFMEPRNLGSFEFYSYHAGAPSTQDYELALKQLSNTANKYLVNVKEQPLQLDSRNLQHSHTSQSQVIPNANLKTEHLIPAYGKALVAAGQKNKQLVALDGDLVLDCGLVPFRDTLPDRYFECGIAEMDMVGQAGGLALAGKLPVVHSFACFLTPRANEQIYANATEGTKIIYVGSLAGILPSGPGHSHQSVRDIALMSCIPGMTVVEPCCISEMTKLLEWLTETCQGPSYMRMTSIPVALPYAPWDTPLKLGSGNTLHTGSDAVLFSYGPTMLEQSLHASDILQQKYNIRLQVINLPWLNCIDKEWLRAAIQGFDYVFTVDNHYLSGGQGERITSLIVDLNLTRPPKITRFGLTQIPVCGTNAEALCYHQLDSSSLAQKISEKINGPKID